MSYRATPIRGMATALAGAVLVAACTEQQFQPGFQLDESPPTVTIQKTAGDSLDVAQGVNFAVSATDNLGLKSLSIALTGGLARTIDSVFTTAVTDLTLPVSIVLPTNTTAGGNIVITATATDGSDNGATATDSVFLKNDAALTVTTLAPTDGALTSPSKQIPIQVNATQRAGVRKVGYLVSGAITGGDSIGPLASLPVDTTFVTIFNVPASPTSGQFTITGFAEDASTRRATAAPVTVTIQSAANDVTPPTVTFTIADRVEVDDSITVNATDPSGIIEMGWSATLLDGTPVGGATATFAGNLTDVTQSWQLNFSISPLPQAVIITARAVDGAGNVGTAGAPAAAPGVGSAAAAAAQVDTVIVVNGITKPLPAGGRIADAIYNQNRNEIYLTNVELDRLEVFQVVDTSFVAAGIAVGSRPWGIALWPRDVNGAHADTVVVANSGGTNFSIVDVALRQERRRHHLPNFLIQSVQTAIDPATGFLKINITEFDFTDRPEFLATVCIPAATNTCFADSIYAVYSTTPTPGQPGGFVSRGTVRWENLTSATPESHFFWEQASVVPSPDSDTLQVIVDRGPGTARETILGANCGQTVDIAELAFLDTTFVRNSGDFTHALIGEGGSSATPPGGFARALGYSRLAGHTVTACPPLTIQGVPFTGTQQIDDGISPGIRVRDFIVNTAIAVKSVALNFNGLTNLIRADSIYVLDEGLRLMGIVSVGGANAGMDLNFDHAFDARTGGTPPFGGTLSEDDRLVFAAGTAPEILVFDTFFYSRVATLAIRDPVIGPLRGAKLPTGEQILIGVTAAGVVIVTLPPGAINNTNLAPPAF